MTAKEALIFCLQSDTERDYTWNEITSARVLDKNGQPHWVMWAMDRGEKAYPELVSNQMEPFTEAYAPYTRTQPLAK